jgi:hypothetical protein
VIGKGKTPRRLAAFNLPPEIWEVTLQAGWTMIDVICRYLTLLQEKLYPTGPLVVLLGMFSSHRAAVTKAAAESLGIPPGFIPPNCPDALQPLDPRVFGAPKARPRQLWRTQDHETDGQKTRRVLMAENLIVSWERIMLDTIDRPWDIYEDEWQELASDESDSSHDEFRQHMMREDLEDLIQGTKIIHTVAFLFFPPICACSPSEATDRMISS